MDNFIGGCFLVDMDLVGEVDVSQCVWLWDSLFLMVYMWIGDGFKVYEVRVCNLFEGGLMVEFDCVVVVDIVVMLDFCGIGEIGGKVVWCIEGCLGIVFDEQIDLKKVCKLVGGGKLLLFYVKLVLWC